MGNTSSISSVLGPVSPTSASGDNHHSSSSSDRKSSKKSRSKNRESSTNHAAATAAETATERAKKVLGNVHDSLRSSVKKLEEQDHPAAHLIDTVCGPYFETSTKKSRKMRDTRSSSFYSEDYNSDDSRGTLSEDEQTLDTEYNANSTVNESTIASSAVPPNKEKSAKNKDSMDSSYLSQSDYESEVGNQPNASSKSASRRKTKRQGRDRHRHHSDDPSAALASDEDEDVDDDSKTLDTTTTGTNTNTNTASGAQPQQLLSKPLASSFAKRCYFTKAGIGKATQHYEGLTLTGNVVLMLAAAMKLKGCPTICDEDLRRVEQTYPNQFSRLPDELLLSSGWRRISKYCHFSNKPIPDGIPFFHSKQRLHPQGGYYFLLAAAVGMVRPIDVEPLTRDTLVLLETDYPSQCDAAPEILIQDPDEWTLVDKFCFFSGGPINTEEDVYYQADFDGNPIYMLAFLSPSLTPEELYKLDTDDEVNEDGEPTHGLTSVAAVQEVESVYDLTERDFHDLKLYHLGPCRALPQYILQPQAWIKVLPPHFLDARHRAILRAQQYEMKHGGPVTPIPRDPSAAPAQQLTVGATPLDGRYDPAVGPPPDYNGQLTPNYNYQQHYEQGHPHGHGHPYPLPPHHHHHHHPGSGPHGHNLSEEIGYYMQPSPMNAPGQAFSSEYETVGPHNSASMADTTMAAYQHHPHQHHHSRDPHQQPHPHHYDTHQQQSPSPHYHQDYPSTHRYQQQQHHQALDGAGSQTGSQQSSSFQREVEEEGAFVDTTAAPLDEAIGTRKAAGPPGGHETHQQGMDPPEHLPADPEIDDSVVASEAMSGGNLNNTSNASGSYYSHPDDPLQVSKTESQYSSPGRGDAPSYNGGVDRAGDNDDVPVYSYSPSPEKGGDEYYHHHPHEQSRDDQYYDSPEGLVPDHPGSQDHEFFNAPSGNGEEEEDYDPNVVQSFDPHEHMVGHPDDHQFSPTGSGSYYDDEASSGRLELQESSSAEYFRGGGPNGESPSPIKMDHLRSLGRNPQQQQQQSPHRPTATASPMSQANSQNSVSEYSHSSAMRGAQELLKRNRQRRHEQARRRLNNANAEVRVNEPEDTDGSPMKSPTHYAFAPDGFGNGGVHRVGDDGSASTWESANSEGLTSVISGSSVWTDNSSNPADRSSRRALILQMAKARMKSNKERDPAEKTIKEEKSGSLDDTDVGYDDEHNDMRPQGSAEVTTADLDFAADLD